MNATHCASRVLSSRFSRGLCQPGRVVTSLYCDERRSLLRVYLRRQAGSVCRRGRSNPATSAEFSSFPRLLRRDDEKARRNRPSVSSLFGDKPAAHSLRVSGSDARDPCCSFAKPSTDELPRPLLNNSLKSRRNIPSVHRLRRVQNGNEKKTLIPFQCPILSIFFASTALISLKS